MADELFPTFNLPRGVTRRLDPRQRPSYKPAPRWNFETGDFDIDGAGNIVFCDGYEAWAQWIVKAILCERTGRMSKLMYGGRYGASIDDALKLPRQDAATALEVAITRAAIANPQTRSVHDFGFSWGPDWVEVSFIAEPVVGPNRPIIVTLGSTANG